MRDYKIFVSIADIHIGRRTITAKEMKRQLKTQFFDVINRFSRLDGIFVLGDTSHCILSLNSDYSNVYLWFFDQLYKTAKKKNATVVVVKGTPAHENDQLSNVHHYINNDDGVDFRIYETYEETTIWDDYKVLILPDVHVKNTSEITKYLTKDKHYDLILGHGLTSSMKFFVQESESMPMKTYEYEVKDLCDSCKGPVMFGHIHQHQIFRKQFYYVGNFTVLERGINDGGYLVGGICDSDRSKWKLERYINPESATYHEFKVGRSILSNYSIDEIIDAIDELLEGTKPNDLITLRITRGDALEESDKVYMLEARYRKDHRISIVKKVKTKKEEEHEEENKARHDKYAYTMDRNLDMSEILYRYYETDILPTLAEEYNKSRKLTLEDFRRVLKEDKS